MTSAYDILAITILAAAAGLPLLRLRHERPAMLVYGLAAAVAAVGQHLGNHGGGLAAVALLMGAAFLLLHLASQPYREEPDENDR